MQQVCEDWPATLSEYDVQQAEIDALRNLKSPSYAFTPDGNKRRLADVVPEPASAILFAQEFGCRQILPAAFYRLSLIPAGSDWGENTDRWSLSARWSLLDAENLLRYIHGCQFLHEYRPDPRYFMYSECVDIWIMEGDEAIDHPCYKFIARVIEVVWDQRASPTHPDPLRLLTKCSDYDDMPQLSKKHFPQGLCTYCRSIIPKAIHEERKRVWQRLSTAFKLE